MNTPRGCIVRWFFLGLLCGVGRRIQAIEYTIDSRAPLPPVNTLITFDATDDFPTVNSPSYSWNFGDGQTQTTSTPTVQHRYQNLQGFLAVSVTLSSSTETTGTATLQLPLRGFPSIEIELPVSTAGFRANQILTARATGTDSLNRPINPNDIQYSVQLEEEGTVTKTISPLTNSSSFTFPTPAAPSRLQFVNTTIVAVRYRYEETFEGTPFVAIRTRRIPPETLFINLRTVPAGNQVQVYGTDLVTSPASVTVWKGSTMLIGAAPPDGLEFENWSNGGAEQHLITIPQTQAEIGNLVYTVTYEPIGSRNPGDPRAIFVFNILTSTISPVTNNTCPPAGLSAIVSFDASLSTNEAGNSNNLSYMWNFGDGTPAVQGRQVQHTFTQQGIKGVTLTVTDTTTNSVDTSTQQVPIRGRPCVTLLSPTGAWRAGETLFVEAEGTDSLNRPLSTLGYGAGLTVNGSLTNLQFENGAPPFQITMPSSTDLFEVNRTLLTIVIQGQEDFGGVQQSVQQAFFIEPRIVFFLMVTQPVGQSVIVYGDQVVSTPYNLRGWAGSQITIRPSPPRDFKFVRWWNDGPETQTVTVPDSQVDVESAFTAFYAIDEEALLNDWKALRPNVDSTVSKLKDRLRKQTSDSILAGYLNRKRRYLKGS